MEFGEFKCLHYDDKCPMEYALVDALYQGKIDVNEVLSAYTRALQKERYENAMRFEESCCVLSMHLGGYFKGEDKKKLTKRTIHIYNKTRTLAKNVWNEKHGYTPQDDAEWEEFCERIYGCKL